MKESKIYIAGMTCHHCEMRIDNALKDIKGVKKVDVSFATGIATVKYDPKLVTEDMFKKVIEDTGYQFKKMIDDSIILKKNKTKLKDILPIILVILIIYFGLQLILGFNLFNFIPSVNSKASLTMLFLVGLLTSVHCIGMCGSINLAIVMKNSDNGIRNPLLYNLGRVISYTLTGAIVGGIGSVLSYNVGIQATIIYITSIFMLMMGLAMLGWLPAFLFPLIPKMPKGMKKVFNSKQGPLVVGLLNGLMPCGPLQAMQLYALASGSIFMGALSMFIYALGTVPLMLGFGILFTKLRGKYNIIIQRISSVIIIFLALFMFNRSLNLMGINLNQMLKNVYESTQTRNYEVATIKDGVQYVSINLTYKGYKPIVVQKGIPVEFNIKVDDISYYGCTNSIRIPTLGISQDLDTGDNIIKFTPTKIGDITYTCWMGMVTSNIKVVDNLESYR